MLQVSCKWEGSICHLRERVWDRPNNNNTINSLVTQLYHICIVTVCKLLIYQTNFVQIFASYRVIWLSGSTTPLVPDFMHNKNCKLPVQLEKCLPNTENHMLFHLFSPYLYVSICMSRWKAQPPMVVPIQRWAVF